LLGPTNLVRVEIAHDGAHDGRIGLLGHQTLHMPEDSDLASGGTCYVQFSPQAVNLSVGPVPESISARNRLTGTIVRLLDVAGRVLVVVDVGQPIWAEVTPEAVAELALRPGVLVTCLIKTSAIQVIP
jgi:molybdopterin-binding protein